MPIFSSISSHDKREQRPCLYIHGPDNQSCVKVVDQFDREAACFTVSSDAITRTLPTQQPICTMLHSTFSGTTTLKIQGQVIEVKQSWESMQYGKEIMAPGGKLKWRPGSGGHEELRDGQQNLLARGKLPGLLKRRQPTLEVFVSGDEFLVHLILATWISMLRD